VFALQTVSAQGETEPKKGVAQYAAFSLHAGMADGEQREKLERLARYVTRPAVAAERLSLTPHGHVRYWLKTAYPVKRDAQRTHCSISIPNTRFRRRAQFMRRSCDASRSGSADRF
jgi:Putative transposase